MKDLRKLESELRAARPEPPAELVQVLEARARSPRRAPRPSRRIALAAVLTAGFVAALAPTGGLGYATGAFGHATHAVKHTVAAVHAPAHTDAHGSTGEHHDFHPTSGHHEYGVPICHWDHDHLVPLRVSDDVLPSHLHHAHDLVPAPPGGCPAHG